MQQSVKSLPFVYSNYILISVSIITGCEVVLLVSNKQCNKIKFIFMNNQFNISEEYAKDKVQINGNKIMYKGIGLLLAFAILDWELFQWLFTILKHNA